MAKKVRKWNFMESWQGLVFEGWQERETDKVFVLRCAKGLTKLSQVLVWLLVSSKGLANASQEFESLQ